MAYKHLVCQSISNLPATPTDDLVEALGVQPPHNKDVVKQVIRKAAGSSVCETVLLKLGKKWI